MLVVLTIPFKKRTKVRKTILLGRTKSFTGDFSSYKTATKEFYEETEKKGDQIKIVYHEGPLTETPVDISGRSMVAAQSELKKNIKDLDINK